MTAFRSLSLAILKGYLRDKQDVFFTVVFPLMFLVLFGGVFANQSQSKLELVHVGEVSLIESMPDQGRRPAMAGYRVPCVAAEASERRHARFDGAVPGP